MTMPEERQRSSRSRRSSSNTRRSRSRSQSISRQSSLQIDMSRQSSTSQKSVNKLKLLAADLRQQQSTTTFPEDSLTSSPNRQVQPFDIEQQHSVDSATSSHKSTSSSYLGKLLRKNTDNSNQQPPSLSQSFSTGRGTTYQINTRPYKGFSTSFCGLFATSGGLPTADHLHPNLHTQQDETHHQREIQLSHLRTDLCSLPCFGVLQADYTRYLFTHTRPPTFCKRMSLHVLIPLTIFLFAGWCSGNIRNLYANRIVCTSLIYFLICWIIGGCIRARKKRVMVREEILWRLKRREEKIKKRIEERRGLGGLGRGPTPSINTMETEEYEYYSDDEEEYYKSGYVDSLGQTRYEMNCAHRMLGCYPSDLAKNGKINQVEDLESDDYVLQQDTATVEMDGCGGCEYLIDTNNGDLCTKLYRPFTKPCLPCIPCWNGSYGFHPQFCGLCGLAQEAREANLTLPRHLRMIDYITMEPFLLYYPRIVELRMSASSSFLEHMQALSSLSKLLLVTFKAILIGLFVIGLSSAVRYWQLADVAVLITTFLQSFVVMYVIHWWRHRLDLSIDAVIKYFACGFVLCSGMAFTIQLLEYLTFKLGVMMAIWIAGTQEVQDNGYGGGGIRTIADSSARFLSQLFGIDVEQHGRMLSAENDILRGFFARNPTVKIFYILISSYIMAGLVEEVCKYFSWVMVDHPDFCSERELAKAKATMPLQLLRDQAEDEDDDDDTNGEEGSKQKQSPASNNEAQTTAAIAAFDPSNQRRSLASIRGGVTTSMVAVALGFTCCENIFTIFIWNRSSVQSEIATLVVKSLFPVNAIAAAIQSIYVCRRDLEKDKSIGLGRILPSIIFHGTYDFALLMITSSWQRSNKEQYFNDAGGDISVIAIISFCASFFIVLLGGLYYFFLSKAQYARLRGGATSNGSGRNSVLAAGLLT